MNQDLAATTVELDWVYTPADFFEEPVIWDRGDYRVEFKDGQVTARMTAAVFEAQPDFRTCLDGELRRYFQGTALMRQKAFELKKGGVTHTLPDGRRNITIEVKSAVLTITANAPDLVITGPHGVVRDTRRERIDETKRLGDLAARVASMDPTTQKLLECYHAALRDPGNALVHLYEIWEGIVKAFGGGKTGMHSARKALNIDEGRLSRLANNEPLKQGRHRGCHLHNLRDATQPELEEARSIARNMLTRYLEYIDGRAFTL